MAQRYIVTRRWVKYKGKIYTAGELLPETFTHHDRFRSIYPSRFGLVEVEDTPTGPSSDELILDLTGIDQDLLEDEHENSEEAEEEKDTTTQQAEVIKVDPASQVEEKPTTKPTGAKVAAKPLSAKKSTGAIAKASTSPK